MALVPSWPTTCHRRASPAFQSWHISAVETQHRSPVLQVAQVTQLGYHGRMLFSQYRQADEAKPSHWFRFSLRTLLIMTAVLGIVMAWIAAERRESRREQELADKLQGVDYFFRVQWGGPYGHPYHHGEDQSWWERSLENLLGKRIRGVRFPGNRPIDYDSLSQLKRLNSISSERISDLSPLVRIKGLNFLYIQYSEVKDFSPLAKLTNLEYLTLRQMKVGDLTPLANLKKLWRLELSGTDVCDLSPLAGLENLQSLEIDRTPVRDLSPLTGLDRLQYVNATKTNVSPDQVEALRLVLPQCSWTR